MNQTRLNAICVYCGSNSGTRPAYAEAARELGRLLAESGIRLVYGGGAVGLMGVVAEAAILAGGEVVGVIPKALDRREIANRSVTTLHVVGSMHERKALMDRLADGFIALPGGFGTLEELCEILTWAQLGIHQKPIGLLNVEGFYDAFIGMLDHAVNERFLHPHHRGMLLADTDPLKLIGKMTTFEPPSVTKWMDREEG